MYLHIQEHIYIQKKEYKYRLKKIQKGIKMKYETKIGISHQSLMTTIPKTIVELLRAKKGDNIVWDCEIDDKGQLNISLSLKEKE
jgi:hypothetical protein